MGQVSLKNIKECQKVRFNKVKVLNILNHDLLSRDPDAAETTDNSKLKFYEDNAIKASNTGLNVHFHEKRPHHSWTACAQNHHTGIYFYVSDVISTPSTNMDGYLYKKRHCKIRRLCIVFYSRTSNRRCAHVRRMLAN
jgi:hypothetical protein